MKVTWVAEAVNVFLRKANLEGGLPFSVRQPRHSAATEAAMREAEELPPANPARLGATSQPA